MFYHFVHALGLVAVGILYSPHTAAAPPLNVAGWLLLAGIVVFSGSLYALALSGIKVLGAITPIGGVCFIGGWVALAWTFLMP